MGFLDSRGFAAGLAVKHADHKFIGIPLLIAVIVTLLASFFGGQAALYTALIAVLVAVLVLVLHTYRMTQKDMQHTQRQIQSLLALYHLNNFRHPIPALGGWTATPELLVTIMDVVRKQGARHVVELGSGASTSIVPYFFEGEGLLTSVEHDGAFLEKTRSQLEVHHPNRVKLHHGALIDQEIGGETWRWYDVRELRIEQPIDVLVVDGPPLKTHFMARYPALPALYPYLSNSAVIIVDDADRPDEQAMLARWKREFPDIKVEQDFSQKGLARVYVNKTKPA